MEIRPEDFEVGAKLGSGGFGAVHRGVRKADGQPVAIKIVEGDTEDMARQMCQEADVALAAQFPGIIPMYGSCVSGTNAWIVMGLIEGGDLDRFCKKGQTACAFEGKIFILLQIARALALLHADGIYHRDIKPQNVLVQRGSHTTYIADFGLSLVSKNTMTQRNPAGTGPYL